MTGYNENDHARAADGRFTEMARPEPALELPVRTPLVFDAAFEKEHGEETARELLKQPKIDTPKALMAGPSVDLLRESYDEHFAYGAAERDRAAAEQLVRAELPHLSEERKNHWMRRIGFAVHVEMKHREDREFILHPENDWEVIIDRSDYGSDDELVDEGNDANLEVWELEANTAMALALDENAAAARAVTSSREAA